MKFLLVLLSISWAYALHIKDHILPFKNPVLGYLEKVAIPECNRLYKKELQYSNFTDRIVGGSAADLGDHPYQAGLLLSVIDLKGTGVCGGSLISPDRVLTAGHCWTDGVHQSWKATVVLGSVSIFNGGIRINTSDYITHPQWNPYLVCNDIAVVYLPDPVSFSADVSSIALPSGNDLTEDFFGYVAQATGFGKTSDAGTITNHQLLSHVALRVISNEVCSSAFPFVIRDSNICTAGFGDVGTCNGDSGGPLVVNRGDNRILIGVVSFGSGQGCENNLPTAYTRVTYYVDWIKKFLN